MFKTYISILLSCPYLYHVLFSSTDNFGIHVQMFVFWINLSRDKQFLKT